MFVMQQHCAINAAALECNQHLYTIYQYLVLLSGFQRSQSGQEDHNINWTCCEMTDEVGKRKHQLYYYKYFYISL